MTGSIAITLTQNLLSSFDALQTPIWVFDIQHLRMWWANRAALNIWQAESLNELLSRSFSEVSLATQTRLQTYLQHLQRGETFTEQWTFYPKNKSVSLWCSCSGAYSEEGDLLMLVEGNGEAGEVVRDAETLRTLEALRHTTLIVSLYSLDGTLLLQNPAAARCYGAVQQGGDNVETQFAQRFVNPYLGRQAIANLGSGEDCSIEAEMLTAQGVRWHELRLRCLNDPITSQLMILVSETDITDQQIALQERQQAEQALRQSEAKLRAVLDSAIAVIVQFRVFRDRTWHYIYYSPGAETIYGYTAQEFLDNSKLWVSGILPEDLTTVILPGYNSIFSSQSTVLEFRFQHKDGSIRWISESLISQQESADSWIVTAVATDITERRRAEIALRESEERFRQLAENIQQVFWMFSFAEDKMVYISPACRTVWGYEAAEFCQNSHQLWLDSIYPGDRPLVFSALDAQRNGKPTEIAYRIIRADGAVRWIRDRAFPIIDALGQAYRVAGIAEDITEQKQAEQALRQLNEDLEARVAERTLELSQSNAQLRTSEEQFRAVFEHAPIGIGLVNRDGQYVKVNQAICQMLGYTEAELLERTIADITHPDDLDANLNYFEQALRGNISRYCVEKRYFKKNGEVVWTNLTSALLLDAEGNPLLGVGMVEDIGDRKRAEAEMREALERERELNELKSRFVSMVSHEFRTPMSVILTSAELLQTYSDMPEEKRQLRFSRIRMAVQHMTRLLEDVLTIGKIESGTIEFNPAPLNVAQFCETLVEEFRNELQTSHTLTLHRQGDCQLALLDESLLYRILTNLISNAVKYSPDGSCVQLKLRCDPDQIQVIVEDSGIGIPQSDYDELFTVFHRGSNVGMISGTGLGLAIVKQCVDLHGGAIAVESKVGQGSRFTVTLPQDKNT